MCVVFTGAGTIRRLSRISASSASATMDMNNWYEKKEWMITLYRNFDLFSSVYSKTTSRGSLQKKVWPVNCSFSGHTIFWCSLTDWANVKVPRECIEVLLNNHLLQEAGAEECLKLLSLWTFHNGLGVSLKTRLLRVKYSQRKCKVELSTWLWDKHYLNLILNHLFLTSLNPRLKWIESHCFLQDW